MSRKRQEKTRAPFVLVSTVTCWGLFILIYFNCDASGAQTDSFLPRTSEINDAVIRRVYTAKKEGTRRRRVAHTSRREGYILDRIILSRHKFGVFFRFSLYCCCCCPFSRGLLVFVATPHTRHTLRTLVCQRRFLHSSFYYSFGSWLAHVTSRSSSSHTKKTSKRPVYIYIHNSEEKQRKPRASIFIHSSIYDLLME